MDGNILTGGQASTTPAGNASYNQSMRFHWQRLGLAVGTAVRVMGGVAFLSLVCFAAKEFVKPAAQPARTYPAHEEHKDEGVTVAVDPYDMADKAQIFSVNYRSEGFLPIFLVVTNDGDQVVSLANLKAQLITVNRVKILAGTVDDVYRRLSHPSRNDTPSPIPIPIPRKKVKGAVSKQALDEIERAQFEAKAIEPHTTQSGFLFFDVSGISTPLPGARFTLSGLQDSKGNELLYFEIPMEKYLSAPTH